MRLTFSKPFSPLFIAALTATGDGFRHVDVWRSFSPLFIAALTATTTVAFAKLQREIFQSAFHRGTHCYTAGWFIDELNDVIFQSAFHRGTHCYERIKAMLQVM